MRAMILILYLLSVAHRDPYLGLAVTPRVSLKPCRYATFQEAHTAIKSEGTIRVLSLYQGESRTPTSEDVELCKWRSKRFLGWPALPIPQNEPVALGVGGIRGNNHVVETDEGQSLSTGKGVLSRILLGWVSIQLLWGMFLQVNIMYARAVSSCLERKLYKSVAAIVVSNVISLDKKSGVQRHITRPPPLHIKRKQVCWSWWASLVNNKRLIRNRFSDSTVQPDMKLWPLNVIMVEHKGKYEEYSPDEISCMILNNLKESAEAFLATEVVDAVITVVAYFSDKQRHTIKDDGTLVALNVMRLISKPTAANCICYRKEC
ncbi:heat shock cognate 70 kDa protein-like protein [Tanacetum coccineum]